jgi:hypothetical protein
MEACVLSMKSWRRAKGIDALQSRRSGVRRKGLAASAMPLRELPSSGKVSNAYARPNGGGGLIVVLMVTVGREPHASVRFHRIRRGRTIERLPDAVP